MITTAAIASTAPHSRVASLLPKTVERVKPGSRPEIEMRKNRGKGMRERPLM